MKRALIDLSSVLWTCLLAGKDTEFGREFEHEGKTIRVNSASFGYENVINHLLVVMDDLKIVPMDMIFVSEGKSSKQERQSLHAGYKAGRERHPAQYEQFNLCKQLVLDAFLGLGAQHAWQDHGVEADDVIGYLALNLEGERWIVSGDKDLAQLVGGDVHHWRAGAVDKNPFGDFRHDLIPVAIALVGDSSDKIPGAKGFGPKAFEKLVELFGDSGLEMMRELILSKNLLALQEDLAEMRDLQKIIDDADSVYLSYELGRLRIEKINTLCRPLSWQAGMVKPRESCEDDRLRKWAGTKRIVSAENYSEAADWARKQIAASPFVTLDIETSTPPESDEWLEVAGKEDKVDVFGSELTSVQITFGPNVQHTVYLPVDNVEEPGISNLSVNQTFDFIRLIPRDKITYVHNSQFELVVLKNTADV
jgi:5'-3' exonuclease